MHFKDKNYNQIKNADKKFPQPFFLALFWFCTPYFYGQNWFSLSQLTNWRHYQLLKIISYVNFIIQSLIQTRIHMQVFESINAYYLPFPKTKHSPWFFLCGPHSFAMFGSPLELLLLIFQSCSLFVGEGECCDI